MIEDPADGFHVTLPESVFDRLDRNGNNWDNYLAECRAELGF